MNTTRHRIAALAASPTVHSFAGTIVHNPGDASGPSAFVRQFTFDRATRVPGTVLLLLAGIAAAAVPSWRRCGARALDHAEARAMMF